MAVPTLRVIEGDIDETILLNTDPVDLQRMGGLDTVRDLMVKIADPGFPNYELSFAERDTARFLGWLP